MYFNVSITCCWTLGWKNAVSDAESEHYVNESLSSVDYKRNPTLFGSPNMNITLTLGWDILWPLTSKDSSLSREQTCSEISLVDFSLSRPVFLLWTRTDHRPAVANVYEHCSTLDSSSVWLRRQRDKTVWCFTERFTIRKEGNDSRGYHTDTHIELWRIIVLYHKLVWHTVKYCISC